MSNYWNAGYDAQEAVINGLVAIVLQSLKRGGHLEKSLTWGVQKAVVNIIATVIQGNNDMLLNMGIDGEYVLSAVIAALSVYINKGRTALNLAEEQLLISVISHSIAVRSGTWLGSVFVPPGYYLNTKS